MIYFDLKKNIIHTHNTDGDKMNRDFFDMLANLRVNHRRFRIHQHYVQAPHGYAGAFILYAAQAYSKGKNEINKNVDFESIAQHYDSLVYKNRAKQYQPKREHNERLAGEYFLKRKPKKTAMIVFLDLQEDLYQDVLAMNQKVLKVLLLKDLLLVSHEMLLNML